MSKANSTRTTKLSDSFRDPAVPEAVQRAERDEPWALALPRRAPQIATATPAHPDQVLLDLCARAAELERLGIPAIEEQLGDINEAIVKVRPVTLRGFITKAKRAHKARAGDERTPDLDEYMDQKLVTALITDLVATEA